MNRQIFEGRFLVNMTGAIIRQDALRPVHGRLNWERMFRYADYHRVSNMAYLGMLGNGDKIPSRWKDSFFERYMQGVIYAENSEMKEREVLTLLDMYKVPCVILETCKIHNLYQVHEMAYMNPLKLFIGEKFYAIAKGYLIDQGYETEIFYQGYGERMRHANGFSLEIYHTMPFRTKVFKKKILELLKEAYVKSPYKYVRGLSLAEQFIYLMVQCIYHYVQDELRIRQVLDLYLYHKAWSSKLNEEYIEKKLADFQIEEVAKKLLALSYMWFGSIEELSTDMKADNTVVYDIMENRILSRTLNVNETDLQAIALAKNIQKEINKERRKENRKIKKEKRKTARENFRRKVSWVLPGYKYMTALYPVLKYFPPLLPIFWLIRLLRFSIKRK